MNCAQGQMTPMYVWSVVLKSLHTTNLADKLWVEQNQPQYKSFPVIASTSFVTLHVEGTPLVIHIFVEEY